MAFLNSLVRLGYLKLKRVVNMRLSHIFATLIFRVLLNYLLNETEPFLFFSQEDER